jgi:hypothetical protein
MIKLLKKVELTIYIGLLYLGVLMASCFICPNINIIIPFFGVVLIAICMYCIGKY